jgi:hypothetical protein
MSESDFIFRFDSDKLRQSCIDLLRWKPVGAHDAYAKQEGRGKLGMAMQLLTEANVEHVDDADMVQLRKIEAALNLPKNSLDAHYDEYLRVLATRQERINASQRADADYSWYNPLGWGRSKPLENVELLSQENFNVWGSVRQVKFGKVVVDNLFTAKKSNLHLHPVFGALLRPTGGIVGSGNDGIYKGDDTDAIVMHGVVHDAAGYLRTYHGVGPGYAYTDKFSLIDTIYSFSGQPQGYYYWLKIVYGTNHP